MMSFRRLAATALAVVLVGLPLTAMLFMTGCRKQEQVFLDTNLAPNTELTSAPGPFSQANYRVHLYWDGNDPDGYIKAYYFAWDDTAPGKWVYTTKTESLFKAVIDTAGETRRHTFYVRAVDNEGMLDPSPARIRFDAWTVVPVIDSLYRLEGPNDPDGPVYDPGYKDTVLMGTPCSFRWRGVDPDGMGQPVLFSYRMDSNPFSPYQLTPSAALSTVSSGTHFFYVKGRDETGAESFPSNYKFVMNYEPDSDITLPADASGTLTVPDKERLIFHWTVRDREEDEGVYGGVKEVWIELDTGFQKMFRVGDQNYQEFWMFTSDTTNTQSEHYIVSKNNPTGGNRSHQFRVYAKDVEDRFETPSRNPIDRERFDFWYNFPPTTVITDPADGDTVCPDFTVCWQGSDADGYVRQYQYVLDPAVSSWKIANDTCFSFSLVDTIVDGPDTTVVVDTGWHEFRVRAMDDANCWEQDYKTIFVYVDECK